MAKVEGVRQYKIDDLLLGTFLDPSVDGISSDKSVEEDDWKIDSFFSNSVTMHEEPSQCLSNSTLDAISAWLCSTQNASLEDVKQEPLSPFNGSLSSFSSENEVDDFMCTTYTSASLDPESFLNQPLHTDSPYSQHALPNPSNQVNNDGIIAVVDSPLQGAGDLNETELKVYQKFIPIKPKIECQDAERESTIRDATGGNPFSGSAEVIQIKGEDENPSMRVQSKRKSKMENDPEQRQVRKQKRMARNRESALQSRQRKKELLQTLEVRLNALSNINSQLKNENDVLKDKIKELESENLVLKHRKQVDIPDLAKKTSCVLVLFVFLAINVKPLSNMSSKMQDPAQLYQASIRHGRNLLEYDKKVTASEHPVYQNIVYNKDEGRLLPSEALMDILDRKVIRKIRRLYKLQGMVNKGRLALAGSDMTKGKSNETNDDCSMSFNKTEVYRLNEALEKLVEIHKKKARKSKKKKRDSKKAGRVLALKNFLSHSINCTSEKNSTSNCSRRFSPRMIAAQNHSRFERVTSHVTKSSEVQTFQYDWSAFERFQKSINRQPDTFYFVSFKRDHILLPPLQYNETQRPRVSFILPSSNSTHDSTWNNTGDKISLMQIDCQVMDTKIFHILKSNIPRYNLPFNSFFLKKT